MMLISEFDVHLKQNCNQIFYMRIHFASLITLKKDINHIENKY